MDAERRLAAIMFTDIVGYTALMARHEEAARRARDRHEAVVRPLVERYQGEWIERTGDETLSAFSSTLDAVNCALAAQAELEGDAELQLRVGIHQGDVTFDAGGVSGDGVNVAARVRPLAKPGGICITGEVHHSVRGRPGLEFEPLGEQEFKNVDHPVAAFAVSGTAAPPRPVSKPVARPMALARAGLAVAVLVAIVLAIGWWVARPFAELPPIRSIAVLPLENLSGDPEQEYFADGMTEALIGDLATIGSLRVISRTSVMQYKGERKPLPEIAEELDVDAVVEGTVMRAGGRVRITAQLIDARDDRHLWSDRYDRELADVLALQSEVARAIAQQVRVTLTPKDGTRLASARPINPDAHEAYLKGRAHWMKRTPADRNLALGFFRQAVQIDPGYAAGYAGLSLTYSSLALAGAAPPYELMPKAEAAALKALELDATLPEVHLSLGIVRMRRDWDFPAAEREFRRALELNPSHALAHLWLAFHLSTMGRHEEAIAEASLATRYDPLSPSVRVASASPHREARDYDAAEGLLREALALDPTSAFAHSRLGYVYSLTGRHEEAIAEIEKTSARTEGGPLWDLGYVYARAGREDEARAIIEELNERSRERYVPATGPARIYAGLGDHDKAFEWLERAYEERSLGLVFVDSPIWDPIRSDPRFQDLLRRIGFPES
jgi:adenylate cyclase